MMNDPWSNLVQALSGARRAPPESWPDRKVHRMLDDLPVQMLRGRRASNPPLRATGRR